MKWLLLCRRFHRGLATASLASPEPQRPFCLSSVRILSFHSGTQWTSGCHRSEGLFAAIEAWPAPRSPNHPTLVLCPLLHTHLTGHTAQTSAQGFSSLDTWAPLLHKYAHSGYVAAMSWNVSGVSAFAGHTHFSLDILSTLMFAVVHTTRHTITLQLSFNTKRLLHHHWLNRFVHSCSPAPKPNLAMSSND